MPRHLLFEQIQYKYNNIKQIIKMNKALLKRIEEIFSQKLQSKTGWGRNEIILIYKESVTEAVLEFVPE